MTGDLTGQPGPDRPVPYSLTAQAEAELGTSDPASGDEATAAAIDAFYGRQPGTAARLYTELAGPDPEVTWEAVIEAADEWDSADADAYQARVEAGLEPDADGTGPTIAIAEACFPESDAGSAAEAFPLADMGSSPHALLGAQVRSARTHVGSARKLGVL